MLRGVACRLEECLNPMVFMAEYVCPKVCRSRGRSCTLQSGCFMALKSEMRVVVSPGYSVLGCPWNFEKQRGAGGAPHKHFLKGSPISGGESPIQSLCRVLFGTEASASVGLLLKVPWWHHLIHCYTRNY